MSNITFASPGDFEGRMASTSFYSQVMDLGATHSERLTKYSECWNFYRGAQWDKAAPEGFDQVSVNYVKAFVRKLRRFAYRNDWSITIDKADDTNIDEYLRSVWHPYRQEITNEIAENAGIFGDWYVYVQYIPPTEEGKKGKIKLNSIDPRYVFPEYNSYTGEMDLCYLLVPYEKRKLETNGLVTGRVQIHREIHFKDKILIQETDGDGNIISYETQENPIGKILIVHGVNQPIPNSQFGCGDAEDLRELQSLMNEKVSDVSDIIDYHAAPITVMYGAKARELEKGANKVWSGLPHNAKVENLKSEGNVESSMEFVKWIKSAMHEIGNVPINALGASRGISNTSAVALSIDFEPLIEITEDKRLYFAKGIKKINELILDIGKMHGEVSFPDDFDYDHNITFGSMLPRDRVSDLNEIAIEIGLGLETKRGALLRLGESDVDSKLKEIEEEEAKNQEEQNEEVDNLEEGNLDEANDALEKNPVMHGEKVVEEEVKKNK